MQRLALWLMAGCVVSLSSTLGLAAPVGSWKASVKRAEALVKEHFVMKRGVHHESEYQSVHLKLEDSLKVAFAPSTTGPSLSKRLQALLPLTDRVSPEENSELFGVFVRTLNAAIHSLKGSDQKDFSKYAVKLWSAKKQATRDRTEVQRVIISQGLAELVRKSKKKITVIKLVHKLLRREVDLIHAVPETPMSLTRAIEFIGSHHTPPTLYSILDAVDVIYGISFQSKDPKKILEPFLTDLVFFLKKVEIRIASGKGKGDFLDASDDASASQLRVWFRVTSMLRQWTGEHSYIWFADWVKFWAIYWGEDRIQKTFDFVAARDNLPSQRTGGTARVRSEAAAFYGIEAKTSRFLLIVDVSGSMIDNQFGVDRLAALKAEAIRFIRALKPGVHYNILPFSSSADISRSLSGSHKLLAKKVTRGKVRGRIRRWINSLNAKGFTRADLAFGAAFNAEKKDGKFVRKKKFRPGFSEIYFITDGSPTDSEGDPLKNDALNRLFRQILALNARHRVLIHTVGFRGMSPRFLQGLAEHTGGVIRLIDGSPPSVGK